MHAALYGELTPHTLRDHRVASSDAYSLFVARSSAMGWLAGEDAAGLWGMNDAGTPDPGERDASDRRSGLGRVAWFQVSADPVPGRPLPVQPFLTCAGDVVARIGTLRLQALQILLPGRTIAPSLAGVGALLQDAEWFADSDPEARTRVRVTVDGGQDPAIRSAAPLMLAQLRELQQDVFSFTSCSPNDDDAVIIPPAFINELWTGPPRHRATFLGALAEWSLDALGWLTALLAEVAADHGTGSPLLMTAARMPL